jgi:hypothetical protein
VLRRGCESDRPCQVPWTELTLDQCIFQMGYTVRVMMMSLAPPYSLHTAY